MSHFIVKGIGKVLTRSGYPKWSTDMGTARVYHARAQATSALKTEQKMRPNQVPLAAKVEMVELVIVDEG